MTCASPQRVNEGSTSYLNATFLDKDDVPAVPVSILYRVDCMTTGTVIRAPGLFTPVDATIEVTLSADDNRIVEHGNQVELRRVTFEATYGAGDKVTGQCDYFVVNLTYIPIT